MVTKDAGLRIRVARELRDEFLDVCRSQDKTAAQVLREFMRGYIAECRAGRQGALFVPTDHQPRSDADDDYAK